MQHNDILKKLKLLIEGKDPHNGQRLNVGTIFERRDVWELLNDAANAVAKLIDIELRLSQLPANTGKPWSKDEESLLLQRFDTGGEIRDIARELQRTIGGIKARLIKCGRIEDDNFRSRDDNGFRSARHG